MNRIFKKILLLSAAALCTAMAVILVYPHFKEKIIQKLQPGKTSDSYQVSTCYRIRKNTWTRFPLKGRTDSLKITAIAEFALSPGKFINYNILYEIADPSGHILKSSVYNAAEEQKIYTKKHTKTVMSNPFLMNRSRYLTQGYSIIIPLSGFENPSEIRLKWASDNSFITGMIVNVSKHVRISLRKAELAYYRMTDEKKKEIFSDNLYPQNVLTSREKMNRIRNIWYNVTPDRDAEASYTSVKTGRLPQSALRVKNLVLKENTVYCGPNTMYGLFQNSSGGIYRPLTNEQYNVYAGLFRDTFERKKDFQSLKDGWNRAGMDIVEIKRGRRTYLVVSEQPDKKYGRGFYLFCLSPLTRSFGLEIPHRFFDGLTGTIGYKLMLTGYFRAAAWNTVHRYQTPDSPQGGSDLAHDRYSCFAAFTQAFSETMPEKSVLIQLHGFSGRAHQLDGVSPAFVLSDASLDPSVRFLFLARKLKEILPGPVFIYPENKMETLAALGNSAAEILRNAGKNQLFIHIEMSDPARMEMKDKTDLRKKLIKCMLSDTENLEIRN